MSPAEAQRDAIDALAGYYRRARLAAPAPVVAPYAPDLDAQLDAALELRPAVVTFHLNELPEARIRPSRRPASSSEEARPASPRRSGLQELGVDFVVAQGGEAGGHRGTWTRDPHSALTGTLALVRMLVRAVDLPVVAAGGIMDGAGIAAVLSLGAQAAQIGTAFIPCPESGATETYRAALLAATEDDTALTDRFSGKPARGLRNRYMRETAAGHFPRAAVPGAEPAHGEAAHRLGASRLARLHGPVGRPGGATLATSARGRVAARAGAGDAGSHRPGGQVCDALEA